MFSELEEPPFPIECVPEDRAPEPQCHMDPELVRAPGLRMQSDEGTGEPKVFTHRDDLRC